MTGLQYHKKGGNNGFALFEEVEQEEASPENTRKIPVLQTLTLSHLQSSVIWKCYAKSDPLIKTLNVLRDQVSNSFYLYIL